MDFAVPDGTEAYAQQRCSTIATSDRTKAAPSPALCKLWSARDFWRASPTRRPRLRPWRRIEPMLPDDGFSSLATWAVRMLLVGLPLLFVVREIRNGALTGCPAYDGVTHPQEAKALCADQ